MNLLEFIDTLPVIGRYGDSTITIKMFDKEKWGWIWATCMKLDTSSKELQFIHENYFGDEISVFDVLNFVGNHIDVFDEELLKEYKVKVKLFSTEELIDVTGIIRHGYIVLLDGDYLKEGN